MSILFSLSVLQKLEQLPDMLVEQRELLGLTQRQLAERLGMKEQQIQRYESSRYQAASLRRLIEVAQALASDAPEA